MIDELESGTLKIAYGVLSDGRIVKPSETAAGDAVACPGCGEPLIIRGGPGTRYCRHFAHHGQTECAPETILHAAAKLLAARVLREAAAERSPIRVHRSCSKCNQVWSTEWRPRGDNVEVEYRLDSGRVADVALLNAGSPVALVEIHVSNLVTDEKAEALGGLPCAELEAVELLAQPLDWRPRAERTRGAVCPSCSALKRAYAEANVPPWVEEMRISGDETDFVTKIVLREREIRYLVRYEVGCNTCDHTIVDQQLALLDRELQAGEWRRHQTKREQYVRERAARYPTLPEHVKYFWEIEAAIVEFGGRLTPPASPGWAAHLSDRTYHDHAHHGPAENRWSRIRRIAAKTGQPIPASRSSPYWVEPFRCYADDCGTEMLVYSWVGHEWMTSTTPPEPVPPTIQLRASRQAEASYWANTCPKCKRVQGEYFVYQPRGPLPSRLAGRRDWW